MGRKKRVMVAMSGGVDSAVAAALVKEEGYETIGVTMCFNITEASDRKRPSCCDVSGIEDARRVARILDIRHYVLNFTKILQEKVIKNFCDEYLAGRTPNPCVRCNQFLKFEALFKKARQISCDYLATGHYAKIGYSRLQKRYLLKKGRDKKKDQSYFLYSIKREVLPYLLFPLGNYTKEHIRSIAADLNLPVSDKPASQEICFIPDRDYHSFLSAKAQAEIKPGPFIHLSGRILGEHKGIPFYTIGQRKALGGGHRAPLYVIRIDSSKNTIVLGEQKYTYSSGLIADNVKFLTLNNLADDRLRFKKTIAIKVKIRYNHREVKSGLIPIGEDSVRIKFNSPQKAVTPGQSVVFYDRDVVLGGGIIRESV